MDEKKLLLISVFTSSVGISILLFITANTQADHITFNEIEETGIEKSVKIIGTVEQLFEGNKSAVLRVSCPEHIDVVAIGKLAGNLTLDTKIEVIGTVDSYEGKRQILARRIRVV